MADQTIRGKCQNLFGGPIAAQRAYTLCAGARKGIARKKFGALSHGEPQLAAEKRVFRKASFDPFGSKLASKLFRIMLLF